MKQHLFQHNFRMSKEKLDGAMRNEKVSLGKLSILISGNSWYFCTNYTILTIQEKVFLNLSQIDKYPPLVEKLQRRLSLPHHSKTKPSKLSRSQSGYRSVGERAERVMVGRAKSINVS